MGSRKGRATPTRPERNSCVAHVRQRKHLTRADFVAALSERDQKRRTNTKRRETKGEKRQREIITRRNQKKRVSIKCGEILCK